MLCIVALHIGRNTDQGKQACDLHAFVVRRKSRKMHGASGDRVLVHFLASAARKVVRFSSQDGAKRNLLCETNTSGHRRHDGRHDGAHASSPRSRSGTRQKENNVNIRSTRSQARCGKQRAQAASGWRMGMGVPASRGPGTTRLGIVHDAVAAGADGGGAAGVRAGRS